MGTEDFQAFFDELGHWGAVDSDDPKSRVRARILHAASELFERQGYRKSSVDQIARKAGVAKGSVYLHFKSKAEILIHAVAEEKKQAAQQAKVVLTRAQEPTQRIEAYLELLFATIPQLPLLARLMSGDREILVALEDLGDDLATALVEQQRAFLRMLLMSVPGSDPQTVDENAAVLLGLVYAAEQIIEGPGRGAVTRADYARMLARLLTHGVKR